MAKKAKKATRRRGRPFLWLTVMGIAIVFSALPSVMIFLVGMLPTMVAFLIDRSYLRSATFTVGSLNFAGVFPYLLELWGADNDVDAAQEILTNVFSLFVMYSASAFGWLVFFAVPPVVISFLSVISQRRIAKLRAEQRRIIEEWGEDVAKIVDAASLAEEEEKAEAEPEITEVTFGEHEPPAMASPLDAPAIDSALAPEAAKAEETPA